MSKIICDVCGTSYPETATQCPICGCVRPGEPLTVDGNGDNGNAQPAGTYTYVKGGRFSKTNVKKRNKGKAVQHPVSQELPDTEENAEQSGSNKGLVVAVVLLLVAIIGVVAYIAIRLLVPAGIIQLPTAETTVPASSVSTTAPTEPSAETTAPEIACTDVIASKKTVTLSKLGAAELLNVTTLPKDTTDAITFKSSDEKIVTVSDKGKVTAVAPGEATITVTCGKVDAEVNVICDFEVQPEETTAPTTAPVEFALNREDFTMKTKGEKWLLYDGDIPKDQIKWSISDEKVATVNNGTVTAVGVGYATVYAEYNGVKLTCIVRCSESVGAAQEETPAEDTPKSEYTISATDVTLTVHETFALILKDKAGNAVSVTWTPADGSVCSTEGNNIKALAVGSTTVTTVYEGITYACIIRVK